MINLPDIKTLEEKVSICQNSAEARILLAKANPRAFTYSIPWYQCVNSAPFENRDFECIPNKKQEIAYLFFKILELDMLSFALTWRNDQNDHVDNLRDEWRKISNPNLDSWLFNTYLNKTINRINEGKKLLAQLQELDFSEHDLPWTAQSYT